MLVDVGKRLGSLEITALLGKGGMGEVYRARDTRLGRDVAVKVSSERFNERFEREARAIASLNHPNICTLYDVGPNYLVMELVEGETLKGPVPLDRAIAYARQIAEALEAAHDTGIVHRDLKPANIKVTPSGVVKVLDFGLAKTSIGPLPENSPTAIVAETGVGVILGTAGYMSPEQATGKPVDKRADIWAFGVVLYEMVTGRRLFDGDNLQETLASVIKDEPDLARAPAIIQPLLRRCLVKDPRRRLRDIGDAMAFLEEARPETPRQRAGWLWPAVTALTAAVAIVAVALWAPWRKPPTAEITRFQIPIPEKQEFGYYVALSPDGRKLLFTAQGVDGRLNLWVHDMDSLTSRQLPGTEITNGFGSPFWSPDNRFVAFSEGGRLMKVDASGTNSPITVAQLNAGMGLGSWGQQGIILVGSRSGAGPILRLSEVGGEPLSVTAIDESRGEVTHQFPFFLPDGRHFLYLRTGNKAIQGIYIGSLDLKPEDQPTNRLLESYAQVVYVPSSEPGVGRLLFMREGNGQLLTQAFDSNRLVLVGDATIVAEEVGRTDGAVGYGFFSAAANGTLAYRNRPRNQLSWVDLKGNFLESVGAAGVSGFVRISPDGKRLAIDRNTRGSPDVWLLDFARGIETPLTFDTALDDFAIWSPESARIVFRSLRQGSSDLYIKAADGVGAEQLLLHTDRDKWPDDWSSDGRFLMYEEVDANGKEDLWLLPMQGAPKPIRWTQSPFRESFPQFSPDMRWIAYQSDDSGRSEVYVRPFDPPGISAAPLGAAYQVSNAGGSRPLWSKGGKELIYLGANRVLTAVDVVASPKFQTGPPKPLFQITSGIGVRDLDLHPDGRRIIMPTPAEGDSRSPITVVLNWQVTLKH